jgi:hypothetical protein
VTGNNALCITADLAAQCPLRVAARKLNPHTQRGHIYSCKRFAAWLKRSPDTATPDEVRRFQLYLIESGTSICNRNRIMTGMRFLFRVTLRRHDLAAEVWHIKEPERLPPVLSPEEVKHVLTMPTSLKARAMLTLAMVGCPGPAQKNASDPHCDRDCQPPLSAICLRYVHPARWMRPMWSLRWRSSRFALEVHLVVMPGYPVDPAAALLLSA